MRKLNNRAQNGEANGTCQMHMMTACSSFRNIRVSILCTIREDLLEIHFNRLFVNRLEPISLLINHKQFHPKNETR